jgi:hypothetical protein
LFSRFASTMASSDFSSTYMLGVRLVAFPSRPGTRVRAWMRPPRFRAKNFSTCTRSPTARGSSHASHSPWDDVAFSSTEGDRHLGIRPVSQLNTWPVVSPVNASRRPSRDDAHHSGSGRMARPSPWGTFTSYSLPASWRTPLLDQIQTADCVEQCLSLKAMRKTSAADLLQSPLIVGSLGPNRGQELHVMNAAYTTKKAPEGAGA